MVREKIIKVIHSAIVDASKNGDLCARHYDWSGCGEQDELHDLIASAVMPAFQQELSSEREECAKIVDVMAEESKWCSEYAALLHASAQIRKRGAQ